MERDLREAAIGHGQTEQEKKIHLKGFRAACNLVLTHWENDDTEDFGDFLEGLSEVIFTNTDKLINQK